MLTYLQARDEDAIRRKILEKVLTFTSHPDIKDLVTVTGEQPAEDSNMDPALISISDADSSGDSRILAESIEGEDDLVDVTMQDAASEPSTNQLADEYAICLYSELYASGLLLT